MTDLDVARREDALDNPVQAAEAYERAIEAGPVPVDALLDLAVLYLSMADFGYASHHKLPPKLAARSYERAVATLKKAEIQGEGLAEIEFWRKYTDFVVLGEPPFAEDAVALFENGAESAAFYLFASVGLPDYQGAAKRLYEKVREGRSARQRYIAGILRSRVE